MRQKPSLTVADDLMEATRERPPRARKSTNKLDLSNDDDLCSPEGTSSEEPQTINLSRGRARLGSSEIRRPSLLERVSLASNGLLRSSVEQKLEERSGRKLHNVREQLSQIDKDRLRQKDKLVLDPRNSHFLSRWDACTTLALLYTALVTPFEIAFIDSFAIVLFVVRTQRRASDACPATRAAGPSLVEGNGAAVRIRSRCSARRLRCTGKPICRWYLLLRHFRQLHHDDAATWIRTRGSKLDYRPAHNRGELLARLVRN
jgi:hypothetical protein